MFYFTNFLFDTKNDLLYYLISKIIPNHRFTENKVGFSLHLCHRRKFWEFVNWIDILTLFCNFHGFSWFEIIFHFFSWFCLWFSWFFMVFLGALPFSWFFIVFHDFSCTDNPELNIINLSEKVLFDQNIAGKCDFGVV